MGGCCPILMYLMALVILGIRLPDVWTIVSSIDSTYLVTEPDSASKDISLYDEGINMFLVMEELSQKEPLQSLGQVVVNKQAPRFLKYDDEVKKKI